MNRLQLALVTLCFTLLPCLTFAQDASENTATEARTTSTSDLPSTTPQFTLSQALSVSPPERSNAGRELAKDPTQLAEIDAWISNTQIDAPDNLKLKDILMSMPIHIGGPRLAELAKKSADPTIQASWVRWLSKYPDAHAAVLFAWLKNASHQPKHFAKLLNDYAVLKPDDALHIWVQLRANHPLSELQHTADFGLKRPGCATALATAISSNEYSAEIPLLRLTSALSSCEDTSLTLADDKLGTFLNQQSALLSHKLPSRRIVAIDALGMLAPHSLSFVPTLIKTFEGAQNTTERAHALRALHKLNASGQSERLINALTTGDETLRFEAASLIASSDNHNVDVSILKTAFEQEKWTDTQFALYHAIEHAMPTGTDKSNFQKQIVFDASRSLPLRQQALRHLTAGNAQAMTLDDMAKLTTDGAALELIASCAEHIYATQPEARPTLRTWLIAQQPFERRILSSFIAFMRVDSSSHDPGAMDTLRTICAHAAEQDNILQPCIIYLNELAETDEDKLLLQNLQTKKAQFDAMANIEF